MNFNFKKIIIIINYNNGRGNDETPNGRENDETPNGRAEMTKLQMAGRK